MILIFIERERVTRCNPDLQHLQLIVTSTERSTNDRCESHPVGVRWYVGRHLLENFINDQFEVVLLLAADFIPVDDPRLAYTKAKDSTVSIEE